MRPRIHIFALLAACLVFPMAWADDGVLEINQTCAVNEGCFTGDSAGYPVEISSPGAYVLTGSLSVPADTSGIEIVADNVTLNLNGFAITGPVTCSGTPVTSCSSSGAAVGIQAGGQEGVTVSNGRVSGFNDTGISLGNRASLNGIRTSHNSSNGVDAGGDSRIVRTESSNNGASGFNLAARAVVSQAQLSNNGDRGIDAGATSVIQDSTSFQNADDGLFVGESSTIRGVTISGNQDQGVVLYNGSSLVADSTLRGNTGFGVDCVYGGASGLRNIVADANNGGGDQFGTSDFGTCVELATNICQVDANCP